jgi:zinc transporter ZupT
MIETSTKSTPIAENVWMNSTVAVTGFFYLIASCMRMTTYHPLSTAITLLGLLGISFVPILKRTPESAEKIFIFMLSTATGALLGDSFLHLIPDAFGLHSHSTVASSSRAHFSVGLTILAGVYVFFLFEKLLSQYHHGHGHGHSHPHSHARLDEDHQETEPASLPSLSEQSALLETRSENSTYVNYHPSPDSFGTSSDERKYVHPVGYLVLFGDILHNFVDGLAIGVSFATNYRVGLSTTMAVIMVHIR